MDETKKYLVNVESNLDEYAQKADEARKRVDEFIAANADLLDKNKEMTPEMERRAAFFMVFTLLKKKMTIECGYFESLIPKELFEI